MKLPFLLLLIITLSGCATQTTTWQNDEVRRKEIEHPVFYASPGYTYEYIDGRKIEVGTRSDGVVVWRDAKP